MILIKFQSECKMLTGRSYARSCFAFILIILILIIFALLSTITICYSPITVLALVLFLPPQ